MLTAVKNSYAVSIVKKKKLSNCFKTVRHKFSRHRLVMLVRYMKPHCLWKRSVWWSPSSLVPSCNTLDWYVVFRKYVWSCVGLFKKVGYKNDIIRFHTAHALLNARALDVCRKKFLFTGHVDAPGCQTVAAFSQKPKSLWRNKAPKSTIRFEESSVCTLEVYHQQEVGVMKQKKREMRSERTGMEAFVMCNWWICSHAMCN